MKQLIMLFSNVKSCIFFKLRKINLHSHSYCKPIVSRYISFNTRDIVYECRCGKRKIIRDYRPFDIPFPIKTNHFITNKELKDIANSKG